MGYMNALAMAEANPDLRSALSWHLGSNHYPPVPQTMIDPCVEAIEATVDGDHDRMVPLPDGITWHGQTGAPAWAIVESHHLDAFVEVESW